MKKGFLTSGFMVILMMFFTCKVFAAPKSAGDAILDAQAMKKYLFVVFYEKKDGFYKAMNEELKKYVKSMAEKPLIYSAKMTDAKEAEIISKYRVIGAPMPLLLVFAPNGVITGGFPQKVTEQQLKSSFPSQLVLNILKIMQEGKIALVMLQNNGTKFNKESTKAAEDFSGTKGLVGAVDTIYADPDDAGSKDLMMQSKMQGAITEATIIMIVPPGRIGGVFTGKTDQKKLMTGLQACSGGSCKPGACGPKK